jgi:signal transduction histidine kinase
MRLRLTGLFETLEQQRDRLESLLDRLHDGVLLVGRDLNVQFANDRARELLGTPSLEGKPFPSPTAAGARLRELVLRSLDGTEVKQQRLELPDGRVLQAALPPSAADEAVILVVADETARERAERAQREFATSAAHQLRTPVAAIVSSVEMLQTGAKDEPAARDLFLSAIDEQADRLTRLTRALLSLARAEARQEAPRAGRAAVESLLARVARAVPAREGVAVSVSAELVDAWVDADLLEQALVGVLENAVKHSHARTIDLAARAADDRVVISVADSGTGMSPDARAHAFERFYKGNGDYGFGLGLAIARQAVVAVGGAIEIESEPGSGTTVRVEVPAYAEARIR